MKSKLYYVVVDSSNFPGEEGMEIHAFESLEYSETLNWLEDNLDSLNAPRIITSERNFS